MIDDNYDPFAQEIVEPSVTFPGLPGKTKKGDQFRMKGTKEAWVVEGPVVFETIFGQPPSKSNAYKIITIPGKKVTCEACQGDGFIGRVLEQRRCPECEGKGYNQKSHPSLGKTTQLQKYDRDFQKQIVKYRNKRMEGELVFEIRVYFESRRPDLDNAFKIILDNLQKVEAFKNDNQIYRIIADKYIDSSNTRIEFALYPRAKH